MPIRSIFARQIFDSCGTPTVEVDIVTDLGLFRAAVPSGSSTGDYEALEIRDGDKVNYAGMSVLKAVNNVNTEIGPQVIQTGFEVTQQKEIDEFMIKLDGTDNKSRLGANAVLGVSLAVAKAGAAKRGVPLYRHIADLVGNKNFILPVPIFNVINGGANVKNKLAIAEFLILPTGANSFTEAMKMGYEVYNQLKALIKKKKMITLVAEEGGFGPTIPNNKNVLTMIKTAIGKCGYTGRIEVGIDAAACEFYKAKFGKYDMNFKNPKSDKKKWLTAAKLQTLYLGLLKQFPIVSIEDPFYREDWKAWQTFAAATSIQIAGDDLIVTNPQRIETAVENSACNCFVLKLNQIGTVTEAIDAHLLAKTNGWGTMVSDRTGDTEDTFIADFVVGLSSGQIKAGGPCRSEHVAKFNQLLRIEEELGPNAKYAGQAFRKPS